MFDAAILADLKGVGYDRSMEQIVMAGGAVGPAAVTTIKTTIAFAEMKFDFAGRRVYLPRGLQVDLGGIAKGWIVEKAAAFLNTYAPICAVSAGGDIRFFGQPLGVSKSSLTLDAPPNPRN